MDARKVLAGIAKYSVVGVAFSIGEPNTTIGQLVFGMAGGALTEGLNAICNRVATDDGEHHDLQEAFGWAVSQAAKEACRGDLLTDFKRTQRHLYDRLEDQEQKLLAAFQQDLKKAGRSWRAARHVALGFSEAELQKMAQLPMDAATDYATEGLPHAGARGVPGSLRALLRGPGA